MVWGFCVYFVYMIPLETDVLRKHRFQKSHVLVVLGGPTFSRGGGRTQLLIPYRTCDFQGESGPPVTPTSSRGPCMTDPSQNDRVSSFNHELSLVCIALIFLLQK